MSLPTSVQALQEQIEKTFFDILQKHGLQKLPPKLITQSKTPGFDSSVVCYQIAKELKQKPEDVAELLVKELTALQSPLFSSFAAAKAFVNFATSTQVLASAAIGEYMVPREQKVDDGKPIVIEFSSPNTNKPQHLGHVRNNCLGDALARMITYTGKKVIKINLVNDRGVHICKSMLAYKKFGKGETPESSGKKGDHLVGDYYVLFEIELEKEYKAWLETDAAKTEFEKWKASDGGKKALSANEKERKKIQQSKLSELEKQNQLDKLDDWATFKSEYKAYYTNNFSAIGAEANRMLVAWENNDPEVRALWEKMNSWVYDGFRQTYKRYGIAHDVWEKESEIYEKGKAIVMEEFNKGNLEKLENGSIACDLIKIGVLKKSSGEKSTKKVLLRANGTSIYMTQDLGVGLTRFQKYQPEKLIYVVACEQDRHFAILFKLIESLCPEAKGKFHHLSYGMVNLPTGRMKSREGTVVDADDLADGLANMAKEITKEKWPDLSPEEVLFRAEKIGMAALKFYILSFNPPTTVSFDPTQSLQFHGKAGPYLLYQYARTRSILAKAKVTPSDLEYKQDCLAKLGTEEEQKVLKSLFSLNKEIQFAIDTYDPSKVIDAIYEISKDFNAFYKLKDKHQVVNCEDTELRYARLLLVLCVGEALKRGLNLIGIETLEKM